VGRGCAATGRSSHGVQHPALDAGADIHALGHAAGDPAVVATEDQPAHEGSSTTELVEGDRRERMRQIRQFTRTTMRARARQGHVRALGRRVQRPVDGPPRTARADTGGMQRPRHEEVAAFLAQHSGGPARDLEPLTGGAWSSAWAYRAGEEELVIRFGPERSWYETDRMAMAFSGPDLPVPQVREVGTTPTGLAYAISVRHHGQFLENTPVERADAVAPTLTRLLVGLHRVPASPGTPVMWHPAGAPVRSWRELILARLVDGPGNPVYGWRAALDADPKLRALSAAVCDRVRTLVCRSGARRLVLRYVDDRHWIARRIRRLDQRGAFLRDANAVTSDVEALCNQCVLHLWVPTVEEVCVHRIDPATRQVIRRPAVYSGVLRLHGDLRKRNRMCRRARSVVRRVCHV
jgi:hypothetical protein